MNPRTKLVSRIPAAKLCSTRRRDAKQAKAGRATKMLSLVSLVSINSKDIARGISVDYKAGALSRGTIVRNTSRIVAKFKKFSAYDGTKFRCSLFE